MTCRTSTTRWPDDLARAALLLAWLPSPAARRTGGAGAHRAARRRRLPFDRPARRRRCHGGGRRGDPVAVAYRRRGDAEGIDTAGAERRAGHRAASAGWRWFGATGKLEVHITAAAAQRAWPSTAPAMSPSPACTARRWRWRCRGAGNLKAAGQTASAERAHQRRRQHGPDAARGRRCHGRRQRCGQPRPSRPPDRLQATVNGVGTITYTGSPQKVESAINGVGSIAPAAPSGS